MHPSPHGCSSIGRAAVSKTAGCGFKSCHPCIFVFLSRRAYVRAPAIVNEPAYAMKWIRDYIQDVVSEMKKVSWPSRDELISSTLITLLGTVMISGFIFVADQIISTIMEMIY